MGISFPRRSLRLRLVLVCAMMLALWFSLSISPQVLITQTNCPQTPTTGKQDTWPKDTTVQVNITPVAGLEQRHIDAFEAAFVNWTDANTPSGNASNVTFECCTMGPSVHQQTNTVQIDITTPVASPRADVGWGSNSNGVQYARVRVNPNQLVHDSDYLTNLMAHEMGHTFGLGNCNNCDCTKTVMGASPCTPRNLGPTPCDNTKVKQVGQYGVVGGGGGFGCICSPEAEDACWAQVGWYFDPDDCCCRFNPHSPILVDILGNGFDLTNASNGVNFDLDTDGIAESLGWTASDSTTPGWP